MKKKFVLVFVVVFFLSSIVIAATSADYYNYGNTIFSRGDYKKAITYYNYAAKLEPKNPTYYSAIADCYEKMGNQTMANKFSAYAKTLPQSVRNGVSMETMLEKIKFTAFAGFTTASMTKVNSEIKTVYDSLIAAGATASKQNFGNGFIVGTQSGYSLMKGLYIGPRLEYVGILPGKTTGSLTFFGTTAAASFEYSGSILDVMGGTSYYYLIPGVPLTISGDLYLGYGLAGANYKIASTSAGVTNEISYGLNGGTFVAVIGANADYKLTNSFSAGLSLGYRMANVSQMKLTEDYVSGGVTVAKKGDVLNDSSGSPLPFDFSGLIISINGNYSF